MQKLVWECHKRIAADLGLRYKIARGMYCFQEKFSEQTSSTGWVCLGKDCTYVARILVDFSTVRRKDSAGRRTFDYPRAATNLDVLFLSLDANCLRKFEGEALTVKMCFTVVVGERGLCVYKYIYSSVII